MEGKTKDGSSSSSFTSDLFGSKESYGSSSSEIFRSIFGPSSKGFGRESDLLSEPVEKKRDSASRDLNSKRGTPDSFARSNEGGSQSIPNKDTSWFYHQERVQPCHLSSSIYYGGQDNYSQPQNNQTSAYFNLNKDGGEDDSDSASRGNWWKGGLHY